ncbi:MAG: guanylate kinase [Lachnospiraceae bacterium]|nr:guanylate kinase [Lachnospiraceae bacterium]
MGKLFYIMGKSASGKDTLYRILAGDRSLGLRLVIPYTTRPVRQGEQEGETYHFVDKVRLDEMRAQGRVIESRCYHTVHGDWYYFTADDGQIDLSSGDYLMIGTLESYEKTREYLGKDQVVPIYIEVEDGERLQRALNRERIQQEPKYQEMCRRFLADAEDFSEGQLERLEISRRFCNDMMERCLAEIRTFISDYC